MASTTFVDQVTQTTAEWFNEVNDLVHVAIGGDGSVVTGQVLSLSDTAVGITGDADITAFTETTARDLVFPGGYIGTYSAAGDGLEIGENVAMTSSGLTHMATGAASYIYAGGGTISLFNYASDTAGQLAGSADNAFSFGLKACQFGPGTLRDPNVGYGQAGFFGSGFIHGNQNEISAGNYLTLSQNSFRNNSGNEVYVVTDEASSIRMVDGTVVLRTATSGTVGNTVSWITSLTAAPTKVTTGVKLFGINNTVSESWHSSISALKVGAYAALGTGANNGTFIHNNAYSDDGSTFKYINNGFATRLILDQSTGYIGLQFAGSGTAGNTASLTNLYSFESTRATFTPAQLYIDCAPSETWHSSVSVIRLGARNSIVEGAAQNCNMLSNAYTDDAATFKRIQAGYASRIVSRSGAGGIEMNAGSSGSANATVSLDTVFDIAYGGAVHFPLIGTTASGANAFIDTGTTPANSLLISTSSRRYKADIAPLREDKADRLFQLAPVEYRSTAAADNPDWTYYGLVAEDVAAVEPRLVSYSYLPEDTEFKVTESGGRIRVPKAGAVKVPNAVQYDRLTVLLLDVVKRQEARITALEALLPGAPAHGNAP